MDLQTVAAMVIPLVLFRAVEKQILRQLLSEAEGSLALPGILGSLQSWLHQAVPWAPGVGDIFQLHLQGLEAVFGACR